jgi:hypothetical protein
MQRLEAPVRVAVLETPAGFQPNSAQVADEIAAYIDRHLVNFRPTVERVEARSRKSAQSPDNVDVLAPMRSANLLLVGPGSPTYAVRQLADSRAWSLLQARHRLGAGVLLSSATTLAASRWTLPVYEIYKVGADLHWVQGLDLMAQFGLNLLLISHWNNSDGGDDLDTSRCYIGRDRFEALRAQLPTDEPYTLVGIDEKTALCIDFAEARVDVVGVGGAVIERDGETTQVANKESFPLDALGAWQLPVDGEGIDAAMWELALQDEEEAERARQEEEEPVAAPPEVAALVEQRQAAREAGAWDEADRLREEATTLGWRIQDTPQGPVLEPEAS